jgi:hypothetical protein
MANPDTAIAPPMPQALTPPTPMVAHAIPLTVTATTFTGIIGALRCANRLHADRYSKLMINVAPVKAAAG